MKILNNKLFFLKNEKYSYNFPLSIFDNKNVIIAENKKDLEKRLKNKNIYYGVFNKKDKNILIKRVFILKNLVRLVKDFVKREEPLRKILSIYSYGSYLYGNSTYLPEDIDVGIILDGSMFRYIIDKVRIPYSLFEKNNLLTRKINFFLYGKDNLSFGIPVEDTVITGIIHKEVVKRELSVAYWRNIVIWGKDFKYIKDNEKNVMVVIARMIIGCHERLKSYGNNKKESKEKSIRKITNRLFEVNIFLDFFDKKFNKNKAFFIKKDYILNNKNISIRDIEIFYTLTLKRYINFRKFFNRKLKR